MVSSNINAPVSIIKNVSPKISNNGDNKNDTQVKVECIVPQIVNDILSEKRNAVCMFVNNERRKFLLDTGSAVSIMKSKFVNDLLEFNKTQNFVLTGITGHGSHALGTVNVSLGLHNNKPVSKFNFLVCDDSLNIQGDGILGLDFLTINKASISFSKNTLQIWGQEIDIVFMTDDLQLGEQSKDTQGSDILDELGLKRSDARANYEDKEVINRISNLEYARVGEKSAENIINRDQENERIRNETESKCVGNRVNAIENIKVYIENNGELSESEDDDDYYCSFVQRDDILKEVRDNGKYYIRDGEGSGIKLRIACVGEKKSRRGK